MFFNPLSLIIASFITLLTGFIWYHPKVFGTIWMTEAGVTEEKMKNANMLKIFALTLIFSFFISFSLITPVIHQMGAVGMVGGPSKIDLAKPSYYAFIKEYGNAYRTFRHGAIHGAMTGIFMIFPMVAINGLFERKSWKYIFINSGYWIVSLIIMGGIICAWK